MIKLLNTIKEQIEDSKAMNEARSRVAELQNQVKILQVELEDSKMMSEKLTNIISHQKTLVQNRTRVENCRSWSCEKVGIYIFK